MKLNRYDRSINTVINSLRDISSVYTQFKAPEWEIRVRVNYTFTRIGQAEQQAHKLRMAWK